MSAKAPVAFDHHNTPRTQLRAIWLDGAQETLYASSVNNEEILRDLAARFYKKGWLRTNQMIQKPNQLSLANDWTEAGRGVIMFFHGLLEELGYMTGSRRPGEIPILFEMMTGKDYLELPKDDKWRPLYQSNVNTRMEQAGWITAEHVDREYPQCLFSGWTAKGETRKQQFRKLLEEMDCTETFVKEFDSLFIFARECFRCSPVQNDPPQHRRF